ncbi:hypothetical protein MAH1_27310 [Sessilibacter sp. MAH1]
MLICVDQKILRGESENSKKTFVFPAHARLILKFVSIFQDEINLLPFLSMEFVNFFEFIFSINLVFVDFFKEQ